MAKCVSVIVTSDGKILCGTRTADPEKGKLTGAYTQIADGESEQDAAKRAVKESFGLDAQEVFTLGETEPDGENEGCVVVLAPDAQGEMKVGGDIYGADYKGIEDIDSTMVTKPFDDALKMTVETVGSAYRQDGSEKSGNYGHAGRPGQVGGSAPREVEYGLAREGRGNNSRTADAMWRSTTSEKFEPDLENGGEKEAVRSNMRFEQKQNEHRVASLIPGYRPTAYKKTNYMKLGAGGAAKKAVKDAKIDMRDAAEASGMANDSWRVDTKNSREYGANYDSYATKDGSTFSVGREGTEHAGDIVSVIKAQDDIYTTGRMLMHAAVENGGDRLDSYEGNDAFYKACGFEPTSWCEWSDKYAPPDWLAINGLSNDESTGPDGNLLPRSKWEHMTDDQIAEHTKTNFGRVAARRERIVFYKWTGNVSAKTTRSGEKVTRNLDSWIKHHKKSEDYESASRERDASIERDKKSGAYERNRQKIASWNPTAPKLAYETPRREKKKKTK